MEAMKTALTTGANSGIGLATVVELARRGFRSVGTVRSEAKAQAVRRAAGDAGVEVVTALLDVCDAAGCEAVIDEFRPDVLVNNAGYPMTGAIEDVGDEEARRAFETMALAPMRLARLALPHQRERGSGRIVFVSSVYGHVTTPLTGWYQAVKHALEALADALRVEVARDGVAVVLVEPGGFRTGLWEEAEDEVARRAGSTYEAAYRRMLAGTRLVQPLMGDPQRCARVIARAATTRWPRARYLVGYDAPALELWQRLTPTRLKDEALRRALGL